MSVRLELEELVQWISDLSADAPSPESQPVVRETWQAVNRNLGAMSRKLGEVRAALAAQGEGSVLAEGSAQAEGSVLAEFAQDLENEAAGLAFRAQVLSRRAPEAPDTDPDDSAESQDTASEPDTASQAATAAEPEGRSPTDQHAPAATGAATTPARDTHPPAQPSPVDLVKSAQRTLETALSKLAGYENPGPVTEAFEDELDVLAEMTLSLLQRCKRLADEQGSAAGVR
jgi:hypothetical protein